MNQRDQMRQFKAIFDHFNSIFFQGSLSQPKYELDVSKKYAIRWDCLDTIIFGCEFVSLNSFEIKLGILHEMLHMQNKISGAIDIGINQYHKKEFLNAALNIGLHVVKHKNQGWSIISPFPPRNTVNSVSAKSPTLVKSRILMDTFSNITIDSQEFKREVKDICDSILRNPPSKTFFLKYQCRCPEPHNSIRSGRRPMGNPPTHPDAMCKTCRFDYICTSAYE